ncbi:MAG TPA: GMC family oxidoreductase [Bradyrhizobium sp.]|jgi:choline dehydrogenase|nr:GMC family oxidoreductase [Bradyrhizobium sp.]
MQEEGGWRDQVYDFIVVGSGAGGGPVAANLARAGFTVALIEAGGADTTASYEVPAFFAEASENSALRWDYVVHHYDDPAQERKDSKAREINGEFGVWYPRSGSLGGCTAHHALITICAHTSDWDDIAELTGDDSWRAASMHRYFERLERCNYVRPSNFSRPHPGRHGFQGWLTTTIARPKLITHDWKILKIVWATLLTTLEGKVGASLRYFFSQWWKFPGGPIDFLASFFDPNDMRVACFGREGIFYVPFSTEAGRRVGVRDLLNVTKQDFPDKLAIYTNTLVTRVLFDETTLDAKDGPKAIGVELMEGLHLYRADPKSDPADIPPPREKLRARREVIVAGGAFNSPQLLMLSGIGPSEELKVHGITPLVEREGVGRNLQDRYEIGVVSETVNDFAITRGSTFRRPNIGEDPDPQFAQWIEGGGPYATNGVVVCVTKKSDPARTAPDVFMFCVPGIFRGYYPGWTADIARNKTQFSWLILKSHTNNRAGAVTLRTADPRHPPKIAFRYFHEGSPGGEADLDAVVDAIEFVRRINAKVSSMVAQELVPGKQYGDREALKRFVTNEAWGHHASCTNAMGRREDPDAVVDSRFNVIGTRGLRVVDASIFPRIPGFFPVAPIFMIAEKASDVIIADAGSVPAPQ